MRELEYQTSRGVDVVAGPFLIQCKRGKGYAPINKLFEVDSDKGIHLLVTKADRKPDIVCLRLDAFLEYIRENVAMLNVLEELQTAVGIKKEKLIAKDEQEKTEQNQTNKRQEIWQKE